MAKYIVGDLCNCLTRDEWMDYCFTEVLPEGAYSFRTFTGDGTYYDGDGNSYGVDSGTLGICPLDAITVDERVRNALKLRIIRIIDVDPAIINDDTCFEEDDVIHLGPVIIPTAA